MPKFFAPDNFGSGAVFWIDDGNLCVGSVRIGERCYDNGFIAVGGPFCMVKGVARWRLDGLNQLSIAVSDKDPFGTTTL